MHQNRLATLASRARSAAPWAWGGLAAAGLASLFFWASQAERRGQPPQPWPIARQAEQEQPWSMSREAFIAKAQQLPEGGRVLASRYLAAIDAATGLPMRAEDRARAAGSMSGMFRYATDQEVWGVVDYWASPLEMIGKGAGDCEDFAIASYYMLAASGWPKSRMRLGYGRLLLDGQIQAHMVLLLLDERGDWVVDNTRQEPTQLANRPDLTLVFTFDEWRVYEQPGGRDAGSSTQRITKWRELVERAHAEGFK